MYCRCLYRPKIKEEERERPSVGFEGAVTIVAE
jgi:hypothetical protein